MIESTRLLFQKPNQEDFLRFYEINSDIETNLYNPSGAMKYEKAETVFSKSLAHWDNNNFGILKISEKTNPNYVIGFGGLTYKNYEETVIVNLGFRFDKLFWSKGYATEFAKTIIEYGFNNLNKDEIFGLVRPKNIGSIKVLEKCEMKLHGYLDDVPNEEESLIYIIKK